VVLRATSQSGVYQGIAREGVRRECAWSANASYVDAASGERRLAKNAVKPT
jgi:hypothetical protein